MESTHRFGHENSERFADKLFRGVSKYSVRCGIRKNDFAVFVDADHDIAGSFNDNPVSCFAPPEFVLGALPVVDIGCQDIPAVNSALRVSRGTAAAQEPLKGAVGASETVFKVEGLSGFDRSRK
jgi:hypothetical protein